jgi:hypothetical protein
MEEKDTVKIQQFVANKYLWIIGAVLLIVFGYIGMKAVSSSFEDYKLTLVSAPSDVKAGGVTTFTWKIDGPPTTIYHTAVYFGKQSVAGALGKEIHPADTKYNEILPDFNFGKYGIPLQFIGNIKLSTSGKYYYRLHALIKDKNYWSEEYTLDVK